MAPMPANYRDQRDRLRLADPTGGVVGNPGADQIGQLLVELDRCVAAAEAEHLPALLASLSAMLSVVAARMLSHPSGPESQARKCDENLSVQEAARRLGVSKDYLYRHARRLPFARRVGRRLLFSAQGLERWNRQRP